MTKMSQWKKDAKSTVSMGVCQFYLAISAKVTNSESFGHFGHSYLYLPWMPTVKVFQLWLNKAETVG